MLRRLLNIASIVCLVACVALMGMWVRSYHHTDRTFGHFDAGHGFQIDSRFGRLVLYLGNHDLGSYFTTDVIYSARQKTGKSVLVTSGLPVYSGLERNRPLALSDLGFDAFVRPTGQFLILPYWFAVLAAGSSAMLFQLRRPPRFTLRSLFIATTFLAMVLGMIEWLDRAWIGK